MIISCFSDEIDSLLNIQLDVLESLGINHLEIRSVDDINVMDMSSNKIKNIVSTCSDRGFHITCVSSPIGKDTLGIAPMTVVNQVERACEIAEVFGCDFIRIFSFFRGELDLDKAFVLSAELLVRMASTARHYHKTLVMEGGHGTVGADGKTARRLLDTVCSANLRCAYDPGAFAAELLHPFDECFPVLEPYISYVHIKDAKFGEKTRVVAGSGDGQIEPFLKAVADRKDLIVSLEPHLAYAGAKRGFSGEEPFKRAHAALVELLKRNNIEYC